MDLTTMPRRNPAGGGVSLWIDSYSDIFSDFDPRPYSQRAISDDFLLQLKRLSRDTKGKAAFLQILVPSGMRKDEHERVIRKRIEQHFENMKSQLDEDSRRTRRRGTTFTLLGIVLMLMASYIMFLGLSGFHINIILVLFEPAGWFLFWTGLDLWVSYLRYRKSELDYVNRFHGVRVDFSEYRA